MGLTAPQTMPHRHPIAIGAVVTVLLTGLQLPLAAGTPTKAKVSAPPHERFDPLHRHRLRGGDPKVKFGRTDAWVAKYKVGPNGATQVLWKKQLGTSDSDFSFGVATDSQGNVFISGYTYGALAGSNKGFEDAWVAKYSPEGTLLWTQQLGTSTYDFSFGVATDSQGNVFISGETNGALKGSNRGVYDAWVAKYSPNGKLWWLRQEGTRTYDSAYGVATDNNGHVLVTGYTEGNLGD